MISNRKDQNMTIQFAPRLEEPRQRVEAEMPAGTVQRGGGGHAQGVDVAVVSPPATVSSGRHRVPRSRRLRKALERHRQQLRAHREAGMATAEYAIAMIAAAGFAGLLIVVLKSDPVREMLAAIVQTALGTR